MARFVFAVALLVLAVFFSAGVAGAEDGIGGLVLNKTGGESPVKGQEVELNALGPDGAVEPRMATKTDDNGRFSFANVDGTGSFTYTGSTKFQGVEYQTVITGMPAVGSQAKADLPVYEAANDVAIQAEISHVIIEVEPTTRDLIVTEITIISNPTDKTMVASSQDGSGSGRTLWFPLPQGALHPEVTEGLDSVSSSSAEEGLGYGGPILPGKRQVVYSYMLPNVGSSFSISKPLAYPSRKVNVLMADVGQGITSPKLVGQQPVNIKDRNYLFLSGESFKARDSVELNVNGFPPPNNTGQGISSSNEVRWMALAAIVIAALAIAVAYPRLRGPRHVTQRPAPVPQVGESAAIAREKARLLAAIAQLDSKFEAGQIPLEQYREQREEQKHRLRQIWA